MALSTPVFLPGGSHEWRSLVGYSPWGHIESDTTEVTRSVRLGAPLVGVVLEDVARRLACRLLTPPAVSQAPPRA